MSSLVSVRARPQLAISLLVAACVACTGEPDVEPVFDEDLGVQAVAVDDGALAGTFALFTRSIAMIETVLGPQASGNDDWLLVVRTHDTANAVYTQTSTLCGGAFLPVLEVQSIVPAPTWRLVPPSTETLTVDHARGTVELATHVQLWGLQNLDDPLAFEWPTSREAVTAPAFMDHVFDMDVDENPGVTILATGIVQGEMYAAQRKTCTLTGITLDDGHVIGRNHQLFEVVSLGASVPLLDQGPPQQNPTDPAQSWFEEVRIGAGSTCDDVQVLVDDGTLGNRPF
jgi:hypothetical protein